MAAFPQKQMPKALWCLNLVESTFQSGFWAVGITAMTVCFGVLYNPQSGHQLLTSCLSLPNLVVTSMAHSAQQHYSTKSLMILDYLVRISRCSSIWWAHLWINSWWTHQSDVQSHVSMPTMPTGWDYSSIATCLSSVSKALC